MGHISIKVPSGDNQAMIAAATMLLTIAGKVPQLHLDDAPAQAGCTNMTDEDIREIDTRSPSAWKKAVADLEADAGPLGSYEREEAAPLEAAEHSHEDSRVVPAPPTAEPDPEEAAFNPEDRNGDATVEKTDAAGLPWDARIHASTKTTTQDGNWKNRRNVDADLRAEVVAELEQLMAVPTPEFSAGGRGMAAPATVPAPPPPADTTASPLLASVTATAVPDSFPAFLRAVSALIGQGKTSMDKVDTVLQHNGVAAMQLMAARPDLIPVVWEGILNG